MSASRDSAQSGLMVLQEAVCMLLKQHADGLQNAAIAQALGLESDHEGKQKDYLTYSILGSLLKSGKVQKIRRDAKVFYASGLKDTQK